MFSSLCSLKVLGCPLIAAGLIDLFLSFCLKISKYIFFYKNDINNNPSFLCPSSDLTSPKVARVGETDLGGAPGYPTRKVAAFTLIELLVVICVIALLAGLTLGAVGGVNQKANRDKAQAELKAICNALEQYKSVRDTYPTNATTSAAPLVLDNSSNSILPFFIANKIATNSTRQLEDPYGQAYQYQIPGNRNPASFDVFSKGKDGVANSADDIGNW